jgi:flagellar protein FlaG
MDGIANVARQQQTQITTNEAQGRAVQDVQQQTQQPKQENVVKELQDSVTKDTNKLDSKEQVQDLVNQLNKAMEPMSTSLKFGVDRDDIFFISVIETQSNKMIRRFPAEKAADFLPKMKEVTGILFDTKG